MSIALLLTGLVRQREPGSPGKKFITIAGVQTNYLIPIPFLHEQTERDPFLLAPGKTEPEKEKALFNFPWLTAPGTPVFLAALASMLLLRMSWPQIGMVFKRTCVQMKIPIPTIAFMLGLSYVTRYAGMDATLGIAFAGTGFLYPFFAPLLGWLGVFLTGTDAGSNALFGSLQKITATQIHNAGTFAHLDPGTGAGAALHGQQHGRRHGQDDRRPEHRRRHRGHQPARQGGRHLQGRRLAQHLAGLHRRGDHPAAGVYRAVHGDGARTVIFPFSRLRGRQAGDNCRPLVYP